MQTRKPWGSQGFCLYELSIANGVELLGHADVLVYVTDRPILGLTRLCGMTEVAILQKRRLFLVLWELIGCGNYG
jgi:hypothetical protein